MSLLVALVKGYSPTLESEYVVNSLEHDCGKSGCGNAASVSGSNTPALDQLLGLIERASPVAFRYGEILGSMQSCLNGFV